MLYIYIQICSTGKNSDEQPVEYGNRLALSVNCGCQQFITTTQESNSFDFGIWSWLLNLVLSRCATCKHTQFSQCAIVRKYTCKLRYVARG